MENTLFKLMFVRRPRDWRLLDSFRRGPLPLDVFVYRPMEERDSSGVLVYRPTEERDSIAATAEAVDATTGGCEAGEAAPAVPEGAVAASSPAEPVGQQEAP